MKGFRLGAIGCESGGKGKELASRRPIRRLMQKADFQFKGLELGVSEPKGRMDKANRK